MKNMKKALAIVLALVCLLAVFTGCQKKEQNKLESILANKKLVVATSPDFAPLEFVDPNQEGMDTYQGVDMAFARYIASELGVELEIQAMDFAAVQAAVTTGKVDIALSGFAYTAERAESMEMSAFYNKEEDDGQGLLVQKGQEATYATKEAFSGKKVAAQDASLQKNLVTSQLPEDIVYEPISNLNDAVLMLISGKIDALAVSGDNGRAYVENYPDLALADFWFEYTSEGNVVGITKGETELLEKINEIVEKANAADLFPQWKAEAKELALSLGYEINE